MKATIYYFSATGNSLTTAKLLAEELDNCNVVALASLRNKEEINIQSEAVGFVFPIYYSDMPYLMRQVISKMNFEGKPYIFSVCTSRGHYGDIALRLHALLQTRGQKLSYNINIPMPGNSRISTPEQNEIMLYAQRENVHQAALELLNFPVLDYTTETAPKQTPVHNPSNMRGMEAEAHCVGCGICAKICPMDNIHFMEGKPIFGENCISCLACFHWCPQEAIWMSKGEDAMKRRFKYHHPDVTIADILKQKHCV